MFEHMHPVGKDEIEFDGNKFEISVFRAEEDGHLRGHISSENFSDLIAEMPREVAGDMVLGGRDNPVHFLIERIKEEIRAGKFSSPLQENNLDKGGR